MVARKRALAKVRQATASRAGADESLGNSNMQKLFHFDSPVEVYQADACVLTCFDARFELVVRKFLRRRGVALYDQIKIPGAAKALAAPVSDGDRDFVLRMLATSISLHG